MGFLFLACRLLLAAALLALLPARAADPPYQQMLEALTRAHAAVVGVQVTAAEGARSAETLGRERSGSGVVIGPDGLVLTIGYLVLEADRIELVTQDARTVPARQVAYDLATGFGLVQPLLPLGAVPPAPLGSGSEPQPGEALMVAVGGADGGVATVQLASRRPFSGYWEYHIESALFTAPPFGNHSGAPLFNQRGELLGVGSLLVQDAPGDARSVPGNMFVPVDLLKPVLAELRRTGTSGASRRPWLGLNSTEQGGRVQIVRVSRDSPAEAAGLRSGDLVLAIDGSAVDTLEAFYKKLWAHPEPDDEIRLTVLQGAQLREITVKATDRRSMLRKPAGI